MPKPSKCPLCANIDEDNKKNITELPENERFRIECRRCGTYEIVDELVEDYPKGFPEALGMRLSAFVRLRTDQPTNDRGGSANGRPLIRRQNLQELSQTMVPLRGAAIFDSVIHDIAIRCKYPGRSTSPLARAALAARVLVPDKAMSGILELLASEALLRMVSQDGALVDVALTMKGWQRADQMLQSDRGERAFVAMWFGDEMRDVYDVGIRPALEECGYRPPFRVDDPEHDEHRNSADYRDKIDDRILAEIRRSRFLIVDATGSRISVNYEAGFAEGLGIPIIWCCKEGREDDMCFDTRQSEHIIYKNPGDLRSKLVAKISRWGWKRV